MQPDERIPLLVIAPAYDHFVRWCFETGIKRGDAAYVDRPERLQGFRDAEVVIVDLMCCSGRAWDAALLAIQMERDGRITIRPGQTAAAREWLHGLVEEAAAKAREGVQ